MSITDSSLTFYDRGPLPLGSQRANFDDFPLVNGDDRHIWIKEVKKTWYGDANMDGEFNSADLTLVFGTGEYEDGIQSNSKWADGDWNFDLEFSSEDLVLAFIDGGYERGPLTAANMVPEPSSWAILLMSLVGIIACRRCFAR